MPFLQQQQFRIPKMGLGDRVPLTHRVLGRNSHHKGVLNNSAPSSPSSSTGRARKAASRSPTRSFSIHGSSSTRMSRRVREGRPYHRYHLREEIGGKGGECTELAFSGEGIQNTSRQLEHILLFLKNGSRMPCQTKSDIRYQNLPI